MTGKTSSIGLEIAYDKEETKHMLSSNACPVPFGLVVSRPEEVEAAVSRIGLPVVVKPVDGHQGQGATINVRSLEEALLAFEAAREHSSRVIVERFISGSDYRLLVIGAAFAAAAKRIPAHVTGNGRSTVQELIDAVNSDPRRGYGHEKMLTEITVDAMTRRLLEQEGLTLDSVLPKGRSLFLKTTANLSTGGIAEDVTDLVHSANVFMAERIARIIDLDICGIDVVAPSLSEPITENGGAVIEVNGAPGFRMHLAPTLGRPRNVAAPVVDMLFPQGHPARIPIVSVTGTNGKTTTTRLIAHIMRVNGRKVGCTTTDGIFIQNRLLYKGDCSGPESARFVLRDPTVDYAVFETARGGMLRSGLGYDRSDVGVVTNVASDHLGLRGIHALEQLSRLKALVVENVHEHGAAVLNADDPNVFGMKDGLGCGIALFSMDAFNPRIGEHCASGGVAAVYEEGSIVLRKGDWRIEVDKVINIPLTYAGKAAFQIQNVLAACLAAFVQEVKIEEIRVGLQTFVPSSAQLPGRMNLFDFEGFKLLIDYAHNPPSLEAMGKFVRALGPRLSVATLAGTGDRRDEDLREYGRVAATHFEEVLIWKDEDYARGRDGREVMALIAEGARQASSGTVVRLMPSEDEAVEQAVHRAGPGAIICIFTGRIEAMTEKVKAWQEQELDLRISKADIPNVSYANDTSPPSPGPASA